MMDRCTRRLSMGVALAVGLSLPTASTAGDRLEPRVPGGRDRCPVCGMFVAPHPEWIAQIVHDDGSAVFFDGPKDLFKYLLAPAHRVSGAVDRKIGAVFVTGYYERQAIDARTASFVVGSDVLGPMGAELVPHASLDEAREFSRDHRGSRIVGYDEVTPELIAGL